MSPQFFIAMKLKQLESNHFNLVELSQVSIFKNPKIEFEQYPTTAHLASQMLYTADTVYEDIEDATLVDLGIGCGVLSCAAGLLNAGFTFDLGHQIGIDIDSEALEQAQENTSIWDLNVDLIHANLQNMDTSRLKADTVVLNPPFGTKNNKGIDLLFLQKASQVY